MIKRFQEVSGKYIKKIIGQDRFAYAHSDTNDFYDLIEWSKSGGYQGSVILFFDFESWVEKGWDNENDCATDSYDLYYKDSGVKRWFIT